MRIILAGIRLILFSVIALLATFFIWLTRLFRMGQGASFFFFRLAVKSIRFCLNIHVKYSGDIPSETAVIMSNHRSYIDVVLIPSHIPYVIIAKKQVKAWPIIGMTGVALKVIFVDRDSPESRRHTRNQLVDRLREGLSVLVYPEGTTFEGPGILPMKPGIFNTSASEGFSVVPVAIEFKDKSMAWIGKDTFLPHFFRAFGTWRIEVAVSMGDMQRGSDAAALRENVQNWVDAETRRLAESAF